MRYCRTAPDAAPGLRQPAAAADASAGHIPACCSISPPPPAAGGRPVRVSFTPHLMPMTRGMEAACYVRMAPGAIAEQLRAALAVSARPCARPRPSPPAPRRPAGRSAGRAGRPLARAPAPLPPALPPIHTAKTPTVPPPAPHCVAARPAPPGSTHRSATRTSRLCTCWLPAPCRRRTTCAAPTTAS